MTETTNRIDWIDQMRGILFIFVIICHSRLAPTALKWFYEPIFLTGFFFLSGYLFKSRPINIQIKHLTNGLIIPLILYSLILGARTLIYTRSLSGGLSAFVDSICGGDMVWFIPSLILVELIYIVIDSFHIKYADYAIMAFSLVFVHISTYFELTRGIWCWETSLFAIGFFSLGHLSKNNLLSLRTSTVSFVLYVACTQCMGHLGLLTGIDMHLNHYGYPFVFLLMAIWGCVSIVSLMSHLPSLRCLSMFGQYTLFMFPFHTLVLRNVMVFSSSFCNDGVLYRGGVIIATSIICFVISYFVYKYIPALGGKKKWIK